MSTSFIRAVHAASRAESREEDRQSVLDVLGRTERGLSLTHLAAQCSRWAPEYVAELLSELASAQRAYRDGDRWLCGARPRLAAAHPEPLPPRTPRAQCPPEVPASLSRTRDPGLYPSQSAPYAPEEEEVEEPQSAAAPEIEEAEAAPSPSAPELPGAWVLRRMGELGLTAKALGIAARPGSSPGRRRDQDTLRARVSIWRRNPATGFGHWLTSLESVLGPYDPSVPAQVGEEEQPAGASAGGEASTSAGSSWSGPSGARQPESGDAPSPPVPHPCSPLRDLDSVAIELTPELTPGEGTSPEGDEPGGLAFLRAQTRLAQSLLGEVLQAADSIEALLTQAEAREARIALLERQNAELWERVTEAETALSRHQDARAALLRQLQETP